MEMSTIDFANELLWIRQCSHTFASHCSILYPDGDAASETLFHLHLHSLMFPLYLLLVTWNYLPLPILWGSLVFHSRLLHIKTSISVLLPTRWIPFCVNTIDGHVLNMLWYCQKMAHNRSPHCKFKPVIYNIYNRIKIRWFQPLVFCN